VPVTKAGDADLQPLQLQQIGGHTMMMPMQPMQVRMPVFDAHLRMCGACGAPDSRTLTLPTLCVHELTTSRVDAGS
jgi:hypothetical protein